MIVQCKDLFDLIDSRCERKSQIDIEFMQSIKYHQKLMNLYDKYKFLAYHLTYNNFYTVELPPRIEYLGNRISNNGHRYEAFKISSFEDLFYLDLPEFLFSLNSQFPIKKCSYCQNYFYPSTLKIDYCPLCKESKKVTNEIRNSHIRNDPIQAVKKKARNRLSVLINEDEKDKDLAAFYRQIKYYEKRRDGKIADSERIVEYDKELPEINSNDDIVKWAENWIYVTLQKAKEREETWLKP